MPQAPPLGFSPITDLPEKNVTGSPFGLHSHTLFREK